MYNLCSLLLWVAGHFDTRLYLLSSKVQGILWSGADIVIVFVLLKISALFRQRSGKSRIFFRYVLLAGTALLTPALIVVKTPRSFFYLESIICGVQFLILLYTVVVERKGMPEVILSLIGKTRLEKGTGAVDPP